jgi:transposase
MGLICAPYLTLVRQDAPQRVHDLREVFNALRRVRGELAYVDRGCTGEEASADAEAHGIRLEMVKHPAAKKGFVLLPCRWVVERSFAWASRFRRLPQTVGGLHFVAFAGLFLPRAITVLRSSP